MNTKILMTASALVCGAVGIVLTFLPEEVLAYGGLPTLTPFRILLQILGAFYVALGMLDWMTKDGLIGGIYNRPVLVANLSHFLIAGLALIKGSLSHPGVPGIVWLGTAVYAGFAMAFGILFYTAPRKHKSPA